METLIPIESLFNKPTPPSSLPASAQKRESPHYIQMSLAAAMALGLRSGLSHRGACTHCLNLLLTYDEGCAANCHYCGLARERQGTYQDKSFIRVEWPVVELTEIIERAKTRTDVFERMCISMITHRRAEEDTLFVLEAWMREPVLAKNVPVSILSNPTTMTREDLLATKKLGAERFTVALDCVTPELFDKYRGKTARSPNRWEKYWEILEESVPIFGREKIGAHFICGLGETEKEIIFCMQQVRDMGAYGSLHLFAFNPEKDSALGHLPRVPLGQFRRVQLARYLIDRGWVRAEQMGFNDRSQAVDFGFDPVELQKVILTGLPFRTSGCPGRTAWVSSCNRPYGDGPPTDFRSFPVAPNTRDTAYILEHLQDYEGRFSKLPNELEEDEELPGVMGCQRST